MDTIRKQLVVIFSVAILGFGLTLTAPGVATNAAPSDKNADPPDKDVRVTNETSEAVPVWDVKSSARQPFQAQVDIQVPFDSAGEDALLPVPSGKRLVIEFASARGFAPAGQAMAFSIRSIVGGTSTPHYLAAEQQTFGSSRVQFVASQATRIYTDPGADVYLRVDRSFGQDGPVGARISVSGYLEDAPSGD